MEPSIGWTYLSRGALGRARAQLDDGDRGVIDEVGFQTLHQRYADRFFPGTSVLHTRARYLLFIPWLFEDQAGRPEPEAARLLQRSETALAGRLRAAGEFGVIGGRVWPAAASQPPSVSYWTALATWGVLRTDPLHRTPTRRQVHRRLQLVRSPLDDDGQPLEGAPPPFVRLPKPPEDWRGSGPLRFDLQGPERIFLKERIGQVCSPPESARLSLLAKLVRSGIKPPRRPWMGSVLRLAGPDAKALRGAERVASLACIGRAIYAALVEDLRDRDGRATAGRHRRHLQQMLIDHRERAAGVTVEDIEQDIGSLPPALHGVLAATIEWLHRGATDPASLLEAYAIAEQRKGDRARLGPTLGHRARRLEWSPGDHPLAEPLHYRWDRVVMLLNDLRGTN